MDLSWLFYIPLLVVGVPFVIMGYIILINKDQKREIEELIVLFESKNKMTTQERLFVITAKDYLNNLEKND